MHSPFARRVSALLLALAGVAGCSDSTSSATGKLTLLLKDAVGPVEAAVVTISAVNAQSENGTVNLSTTPRTLDLTTLVGDQTATLVDGLDLPAGTYTQLRFVISGAYVKLTTGEIYASPGYAGDGALAIDPLSVTGRLQMPSLGQSGLKVTLPAGGITISDGGERIVVLDFDVSQSFGHLAGQSNMWVMHPVITATDATVSGSAQVTLSLDNTATLPGTVTLGDFASALKLTANSVDYLPSVTDNGDGTFTASFGYLAPGDYTVGFGTIAGVTTFTTSPDPLPTVTVTSGATATTAVTVTGAS